MSNKVELHQITRKKVYHGQMNKRNTNWGQKGFFQLLSPKNVVESPLMAQIKGITDTNPTTNKSYKSSIDPMVKWEKVEFPITHRQKWGQLKISILCDEEPSYRSEFTSWVS